jgi:hypothetical protein
MALKNKYASAGEVPAELKSYYVERDGAFFLDTERNALVDELRQSNVNLLKEIATWKQRFDGIDPDAVRQLAADKLKLEEAAQLKAGEFDKVLAAQLERQRVELLTKVHAPVVAERDAMASRLSTMLIDQAAVTEATKRGLRPTAIPDLTSRVRQTFKLVGGVPQAFDGDTLRVGHDGVSPMTLAEWVSALGTDAPHLFEANAGGGAVGSGTGGVARGVVNPFRKESWNLTEQTKLLKTDPGLAARLKASA